MKGGKVGGENGTNWRGRRNILLDLEAFRIGWVGLTGWEVLSSVGVVAQGIEVVQLYIEFGSR